MGIQEEIAKLVSDSGAGHKRLIEYVVRQLGGGRTLAAVLEDPYVTNRASELGRRALLEEPEVVEAATGEAIADLRAQLDAIVGLDD